MVVHRVLAVVWGQEEELIVTISWHQYSGRGWRRRLGVDGVALCSSLQVCEFIRKHAALHGTKLSISQGTDAFAVTLAMGKELWLEESCFLEYTQLLKMVHK